MKNRFEILSDLRTSLNKNSDYCSQRDDLPKTREDALAILNYVYDNTCLQGVGRYEHLNYPLLYYIEVTYIEDREIIKLINKIKKCIVDYLNDKSKIKCRIQPCQSFVENSNKNLAYPLRTDAELNMPTSAVAYALIEMKEKMIDAKNKSNENIV